MERFSALLALCAMNSPVPGALRFSLICVWINGWVNNGEAGDFRRHHAHYDVTVMVSRLTTTRGPAPVPVPAKRTSLSPIIDSVTVDVLATQVPKSPAVMELTWLTTNNPVSKYRDWFKYAPCQWETTSQCNVVSHWLDLYTKLSPW